MTGTAGIEAAGVETEFAAYSGADKGLLASPVAAQSNRAAWSGGEASSPSWSCSSGAGGFRSGWESLLASIGTGRDGLSKPEEDANAIGGASTRVAVKNENPGSDAADASMISSLHGALATQGTQSGGGEENGIANGTAAPNSTGVFRKTSTNQAGALRGQVEADRILQDSDSVSADKAAGRMRWQSGHNATGHEANAQPSIGAVPAGTLDLAIAAPGTAPSEPYAPETQSQTSPRALTIESPAVFAEGFIGDPAMKAGRSEPVASAAGNHATENGRLAMQADKSTPYSPQNGLSTGVIEQQDEKNNGVYAPASLPPEESQMGNLHAEFTQMQAQPGEARQAQAQNQSQLLVPIVGQAAVIAAAPAALKQPGQEAGTADAASARPQGQIGKLESSGPGADGRVSGASSVRAVHGSGTALAGRDEVQSVQAQISGAAVNTPESWMRSPVDAHATVNAISGHAGALRAAAEESGAQATFAALDADMEPGAPTWIHAGAQQAEAGFEDPALGWVGVRADMSGGGVHASLVPGSAEAAQTLGGHMAGLQEFLAEQHTPVETLTMATHESGTAALSADQGMMQQGASQNSGQNASPDSQSNPLPAPVSMPQTLPQGILPQIDRSDGIASYSEQRGGHISVMA